MPHRSWVFVCPKHINGRLHVAGYAKERHALGVLGLNDDTDLHKVRKRYSELVRRYHPDRNGGDRGHERKLGQVIEAWQLLKTARAFA